MVTSTAHIPTHLAATRSTCSSSHRWPNSRGRETSRESKLREKQIRVWRQPPPHAGMQPHSVRCVTTTDYSVPPKLTPPRCDTRCHPSTGIRPPNNLLPPHNLFSDGRRMLLEEGTLKEGERKRGRERAFLCPESSSIESIEMLLTAATVVKHFVTTCYNLWMVAITHYTFELPPLSRIHLQP